MARQGRYNTTPPNISTALPHCTALSPLTCTRPVSPCLSSQWFALAFFAHWVGLIAVAGVYGQKFVTFVSQSLENAERTGDPAAENAAEQKDVKSVIAILCVAAIIGAVGAGFFLWIMKKAQGRVVKVSLALNLLIDGIALIVCFSVGATAVGVIFLVYFVILAIWSFAVRNRIPFAEAVLTATSHVRYTTLSASTGCCRRRLICGSQLSYVHLCCAV